MSERDLWWKISLVAGLLTVAFAAVYPPDQTIKLGIDLRGGYSLIYEIDDSGLEGEARRTLAQNVMRILKERVDPNGVLNLVWRPIGHNRLEIQMPRPPQEVADARDAYEELRKQLTTTTLRRGDVALALSGDSAERQGRLPKLVLGIKKRESLLQDVAARHDELKKAQQGNDDAAIEAADRAYRAAFDALLDTNIDLGVLETAITADPRSKFRKETLEKLKTQHPDLSGLVEQTVQAFNKWRDLRGREGALDDPSDLERLLRGAGVLEFRLLAELDPADPRAYDTFVSALQKRGPRPAPGDRFGWFPIESPGYFFDNANIEKEFENLKRTRGVAEKYGDKYYILAHLDEKKSLAQPRGEARTGAWSLKGARPDRDDIGKPAVAFQLDELGGSRFLKLTTDNQGKQLAIFLDGQVVSAARIQSPIRTHGIIHGEFSMQEVEQLCQKLNAGSLPKKLKEPPISIRGVGPSLGVANREAGKTAAIYGCIAVVIFMIGYYFYAGAVSICALLLNGLLTAAVLASLNATLTLAGIAGGVLSVAMAVDANVLINERIREELNRGTGMKMAIKQGYDRAFSAIFDSNVTTILTCLILYWAGSEEIRGFALTLGWGVVISLATAVYVTRFFFEYMEMPRIPSEVTRLPALLAAGVAAVGAAMWGLGKWRIAPELQAESVTLFFGRMFMAFLPATVLVMGVMMIMRVIHKGAQQRTPNRIPMMRLIGVPKIDWFGKRRVFFIFSLVTTIGGMALFWTRPADDKYDIEFLGGTSVQIDLKQPGSMDDDGVRKALAAAEEGTKRIAASIRTAAVTRQPGGDYLVKAAGVESDRLASILRAQLSDFVPQGGVREAGRGPTGEGQASVRFKDDATLEGTAPTAESLQRQLGPTADRAEKAAEKIASAQVQIVTEGRTRGANSAFEIITLETNRDLVVDAIMSTMRDKLDIQPTLKFDFRRDTNRGGASYFPVTSDDLLKTAGVPIAAEDQSRYLGGVAVVAENIAPPQTIRSLEKRLREMRLQPANQAIGWRQQKVIGMNEAGSAGGEAMYSSAAVLVADESYVYEEGGPMVSLWRSEFAEPEAGLVKAALERQTSLGKVTQFAPQVASESRNWAFFAVGLSCLMIIIYLWFRFGDVIWGLSAVIALVHDVAVTVGLVAVTYFIAGTVVGKALDIDAPFRIDMAIVAAILTVIGYSVNDTIVVFDRIRENRGKLTQITPAMMNQSINETLSRTMLTGVTSMATLLIMYIWGGGGIHGFNYAMLIGVLTGTYSSVFVASPLLVMMRARATRA